MDSMLKQQVMDLQSEHQRNALETIHANYDNIRAAWNQAVTRRNYAAVDAMVDGLLLFTQLRGLFADGGELFEFARQELAPEAAVEAHPTWGRVLSRYPAHKTDTPEARIEQAMAIAEKHGQREEVAHCWLELGKVVGWQRRDFATALKHYNNALQHFRELANEPQIAATLLELASANANLGLIDAMNRYANEALEISKRLGNLFHTGRASIILAEGAMATGDLDRAERLGWESHRIYSDLGNQFSASRCVLNVAFPAILRGGASLTEVEPMVHDALVVAQSYRDATGISNMKMLQGYIAARNEDYATALQLGQAGIATSPQNPMQLTLGNGLVGYARAGLGHYPDIIPAILTAIRGAVALNLYVVAQRFLPVLALYFANERYAIERAAELYSVAFSLADSAAVAQQTWPLYARLNDKLQSELGAETYNSIWERSKDIDLNTFMQQLIEEFGGGKG